jgi:hypothetical protein
MPATTLELRTNRMVAPDASAAFAALAAILTHA